jgi:hypothetical protein
VAFLAPRAAQELTVDFGDLLDVRTVRLATNVRNVTPRQRTLPWPSHSKLPCPFLGLHYGLYWAHVQPRRGCLAWSPVVALCADTRLCACLQRDASLAASSSAPPLQLSYSLQAPAPAATLAVETPKSKHGTKKKVGRFDHGTVLSGVGGILSRLSGANISPLTAASASLSSVPSCSERNQPVLDISIIVCTYPSGLLSMLSTAAAAHTKSFSRRFPLPASPPTRFCALQQGLPNRQTSLPQ